MRGGNHQTPEQYAKARVPRKHHKKMTKLAVMRISAGLSQAQLAELTGYASPSIATMESKDFLNVKQAKKMAEIFNCDWSEFCE